MNSTCTMPITVHSEVRCCGQEAEARTGAQDDGAHVELAGAFRLQHSGAREQDVLLVASGAELVLQRVRHRRLRHRRALTCVSARLVLCELLLIMLYTIHDQHYSQF